jgi:hypothetical protein
VVVVDMEITVYSLVGQIMEKMEQQTLAVVVAVFETNSAIAQTTQDLAMADQV